MCNGCECFSNDSNYFHLYSTIDGFYSMSSKCDNANHNQFPSNIGMAYKTISHPSVSHLKSSGPSKTELWAKNVGEFSIMFDRKMRLWAFVS